MAVDFHLHSTVSDGGFTPEEVVEHAHSIGLKFIALTDHDSVEGIEPAARRARELGIPFIPGIELTTLVRDEEIHVLGYFIDHTYPPLLDELNKIHERIVERMKEMLRRLERMGIDISFDEIQEVAQCGSMGRPHIARVMKKKGYIRRHQEAFDKYLGNGKEAFVEVDDALTPEEAYHLISAAGGIPVIAHPGYRGKARMMRDDEIFNHRVWGARGIEVFHTRHDSSMIDYYLDTAKRHDLAVTGGTDCHGNFYPVILMDRKNVPDWVGERFLAYYKKHYGDIDIEFTS